MSTFHFEQAMKFSFAHTMTTSTAFCVLRIAAFVTFLVRRGEFPTLFELLYSLVSLDRKSGRGDVSRDTGTASVRKNCIADIFRRPVRHFEPGEVQLASSSLMLVGMSSVLFLDFICHTVDVLEILCFCASKFIDWKRIRHSIMLGPVGTQGSTVQFHVQEVIWEIGNFTLTGAPPATHYSNSIVNCVDVSGRDPFDPYRTGNLGETQAADTKFVSVWQPRSRTDTGFGCRISKRTRQPKQNKHLKSREERIKEQNSVSSPIRVHWLKPFLDFFVSSAFVHIYLST